MIASRVEYMGNMTLEKLALIIARGFAELTEKIDTLEFRVDNLEKRLTHEIRSLRGDMENYGLILKDHESRIGRIEQHFPQS
jgi:hypothetical protein